MSIQCMSWALDHSRAKANDRLVMYSLAHMTDSAGFVSLAKSTIARESHMSEATVWRCLDRISHKGTCNEQCDDPLHEITLVENATGAPDWWLAIPVNRRPRLFQMTAFLGARPAIPDCPEPPDQGSRRGRAAVHAIPSDQGTRNANREPRTTTTSPVEVKSADPNCVRCHGNGAFYSATSGTDVPCSCTYELKLEIA